MEEGYEGMGRGGTGKGGIGYVNWGEEEERKGEMKKRRGDKDRERRQWVH